MSQRKLSFPSYDFFLHKEINESGIICSFYIDIDKRIEHDSKILGKDLKNSDYLSRGRYNGYIAVDETHPFYGCNFDEAEELIYNKRLRVHGGVTLSIKNFMAKELSEFGIDGDVWVVGFDTNHLGDSYQNWTLDRLEKEMENLISIGKKIFEESR